MRLLVYEYTCGGGLADPAAFPSLYAEGAAMLTALLDDLGRVPGVEPVTLLAASPALPLPATMVRHVLPEDEERSLREEAGRADFTILIAPENDEILHRRCRWVEEAGGRLLGPSAEAVRQTSDKRALADVWRRQGVPTPPCDATTYPAVLKPRDGAGSQATFLVRSDDELAAARGRAAEEGWRGELIVQPFVPGTPASIAFLLGPGQVVPLPPTQQILSADGRLHYLGGRLPLPGGLARRAERLGRQAIAPVAGLRGYVGVDVVLGPTEADDCVIEINPRLTTSYVGLRALAATNLAEALLRVVCGEPVSLAWRKEEVTFRADGTLFRVRAD
jgi:hypothetical protein